MDKKDAPCFHVKDENGEAVIISAKDGDVDEMQVYSKAAEETNENARNPRIIHWDAVWDRLGLRGELPLKTEGDAILERYVLKSRTVVIAKKFFPDFVYTSPLLSIMMGSAPPGVSNGLSNLIYLQAIQMLMLEKVCLPQNLRELLEKRTAMYDSEGGPLAHYEFTCEHRSNRLPLIIRANFNYLVNAINYFEENLLYIMQIRDSKVSDGRTAVDALLTPYARPHPDMTKDIMDEMFMQGKRIFRARAANIQSCKFMDDVIHYKNMGAMFKSHARYVRMGKVSFIV
jgi:hypothetical protein